jgi:hypothetical protein
MWKPSAVSCKSLPSYPSGGLAGPCQQSPSSPAESAAESCSVMLVSSSPEHADSDGETCATSAPGKSLSGESLAVQRQEMDAGAAVPSKPATSEIGIAPGTPAEAKEADPGIAQAQPYAPKFPAAAQPAGFAAALQAAQAAGPVSCASKPAGTPPSKRIFKRPAASMQAAPAPAEPRAEPPAEPQAEPPAEPPAEPLAKRKRPARRAIKRLATATPEPKARSLTQQIKEMYELPWVSECGLRVCGGAQRGRFILQLCRPAPSPFLVQGTPPT